MEERFECNLPTWDELYEVCKQIAKRIKEDKFKPDVVVGLARGGFVPARTLCDLLIVKDLISIKVEHWGITATKDGKARLKYPIKINLRGKKVLVVDDIADTGQSMEIAVDYVRRLGPPDQIKTATLYYIKNSKFIPDYFGEKIDWKWIIWPWNYVEDMCNIVPKILDEKKAKSIKDIKRELKDRFNINRSDEDIIEILSELESRNIAIPNSNGWIKNIIE